MRLIDKDALVDSITELAELNREWKPEFSEFCDDMVCLVEDTPFWEREDFDTSFLRKKGVWKRMMTYKKEYICSECGDIWPDYISNFCPNCGADMRGGKEWALKKSWWSCLSKWAKKSENTVA